MTLEKPETTSPGKNLLPRNVWPDEYAKRWNTCPITPISVAAVVFVVLGNWS